MSNDVPGALLIRPLPAAVKIPSVQTEKRVAIVPPDDQQQSAVPTREAVEAAAKQIESYLQSTGRELEFSLDESSGQMVVSVRDATTGDLIRQIPSEAVLRMARHLKEEAMSFVNLTV